jgi:hypothetical protein
VAKVALAGASGGAIYGGFWGVCLMRLGPHSLLGWVWALLSWVWGFLLWTPSYWLQVSSEKIQYFHYQVRS